MKKYLMFLMFVLLISFVNSATDTRVVEDTFRLNSCLNYSKPCFNNGTYCSSSSTCNFTIYNPDNTILLNNVNGTNNFSNHYVPICVQNLGIYKVDMVCDDSGANGAETYYFSVTGSGLNTTIGFYIIFILLSVGVLALGFWIKDGWLVILGSMGLYFLGIYILFYGIEGVKDTVYTWGAGIITLGVAAYISINAGLEMING